MKTKQLKLWNGRGHGEYDKGYFYVAAFSLSQATRLISMAAYGKERPDFILPYEIKVYYHAGVWGNPMNGITPTLPCVYATKTLCDKPKLIIEDANA